MVLHPQDLMVLYKQIASPEQASGFATLAESLNMSLSQVHRSVERCIEAGLASRGNDGPIQTSPADLYEFAVHGVRYAFPARLGAVARGIPTAHGVPPLADEIVGNSQDVPVWPHPEGSHRGPGIEPLAKYVPDAVRADPGLHQLLALQDALRIGRARERHLAAQHLRRRLGLPDAG